MFGEFPKTAPLFLIGDGEFIKGVSRLAMARSAAFITGKISENNRNASPSRKELSSLLVAQISPPIIILTIIFSV